MGPLKFLGKLAYYISHIPTLFAVFTARLINCTFTSSCKFMGTCDYGNIANKFGVYQKDDAPCDDEFSNTELSVKCITCRSFGYRGKSFSREGYQSND